MSVSESDLDDAGHVGQNKAKELVLAQLGLESASFCGHKYELDDGVYEFDLPDDDRNDLEDDDRNDRDDQDDDNDDRNDHDDLDDRDDDDDREPDADDDPDDDRDDDQHD